jgi:tetratricopeptide (TPR) repeat protein
MRGSVLVALDRLDEVLDLSERQHAAATSDEARALWLGCVALSLLLAGKNLDRAEEAARWAYERLPWVAFVETAWGMARIERGEIDEGRAAFERARKVDATGGMGALHTAWTAVAHVRKGELEQARMLAEALRVPGAWPACMRRAERAVSGGC